MSLLLTLTDFTHCSVASIVEYEQASGSWVNSYKRWFALSLSQRETFQCNKIRSERKKEKRKNQASLDQATL